MRRVLLVDDDERIRALVQESARGEEFEIDEAEDGLAALDMLSKEEYQLVVLDVMMPALDGWATLKRIRLSSDVPVILLTARAEEHDKLYGFDLGADDYLPKPFSPRELIARMKAVSKRRDAGRAPDIRFGELRLRPDARSAWVGEERLSLTPKEYDLLEYLCVNPHRVFTREQLLRTVWGYEFAGDSRTVDTHVKSLRERLGTCRKMIATVWGVGYRFDPQDAGDPA